MIAKLIRWSVANRFLVLLATAMLTAWGVWGVRSTPVDALPDLSDVQVIIRTNYPGQAPQIVENQVTYVGHHHAVGARGQDRARLLVLWRLVRLCLVRGRNRPVLGPLTGTGIPEPGPGPIARHGEAGPGSGRHRRRLDLPVRARGSHGQERSGATACVAGLVPEVRTQEPANVAEVASVGGMVKQYQVVLDPIKLASYGLSQAQVRDA